MWYWNTNEDEYVNVGRAEKITISGVDPTRRINVLAGGQSVQLKGEYATLAAARLAVSQLVDARDPTVVTGI